MFRFVTTDMTFKSSNLNVVPCTLGNIEQIRGIAEASSYFNPDYQEYRSDGFTGTVYNKDTLEKIIKRGLSFTAVDPVVGDTVGYMLAVDKEGYDYAFGGGVERSSYENLSRVFFEKDDVITERDIYGAQIALRHNFKGKGVGKRLLFAVRDYLWENGFENIYAEILSNNSRAVEVWGHLGFERCAERKPDHITRFKGSDFSWIDDNYRRLHLRNDLRIDSSIISKLRWYLYKYPLARGEQK